MSAYVTLDHLKEAVSLPLTDTNDDAVLRQVIFRASAYVDEYLRQIRPGYVGFAGSSNAHSAVGSNTRYYDGTGDDTLWIDDAASVASVTVDDAAVASTAWTVWPYNEVPKRAVIYDRPATSVYGLTAAHWTSGTANVAVAGYFGLPYIPDDVAQVTLDIALVLWRREQKTEAGPTATLSSQRFTQGSGRMMQTVADPQLAAILSALDAGWAVPGVWGG